MRNALVAAIVAAIVSAGAATAATGWINGSQIRPGTIRISRLAPGAVTKLQGQQGPAGPQGSTGPQGEQGPQGEPGRSPSFVRGWICIAVDGIQTWGGLDLLLSTPKVPSCPAGERAVEVAILGVDPKTI